MWAKDLQTADLLSDQERSNGPTLGGSPSSSTAISESFGTYYASIYSDPANAFFIYISKSLTPLALALETPDPHNVGEDSPEALSLSLTGHQNLGSERLIRCTKFITTET